MREVLGGLLPWCRHIFENMVDALVNTLVRSVLSLAVVLACIASQAALALTFHLLPAPATLVAGVFATMLFFPAMFAAIFGILGTPDSWPRLMCHILGKFCNDPLEVAGTMYKYIVFLPFECPEGLSWLPDSIQWLLFREPQEVYPPSEQQKNSSKVKNEIWIFINGIATTPKIAKANRDVLNKLFSRPIHLCYNPTDSIVIDLIECIFGKIGPITSPFTSFWEEGPRILLVDTLRSFLDKADSKGFARVVLISHSQGTIITSNALKELGTDPKVIPLMKKYLEVYAFADCAQQMPGNNVKYLENISNGADTVAWLGALFPRPNFWQDFDRNPILIEGSFVTEQLLWGHLLVTHYLNPMRFHDAYQMSRLQYFRRGGLPPDTDSEIISVPFVQL
jgi:hypothetical protein